jgi:WD40 repeat protein
MIHLEKHIEFHSLALPALIWPDEKTLWAADSFFGLEIYQTDIAGCEPPLLFHEVSSNAYSLSPDHRWGAIYNLCELQLFNALNQTQVAAYEYLPPKNLSWAEAEIEKSRSSFYPNLRAHWSPDSEYLAFARNHNNVVIVERSTGLQIQEFGYDDFQTMIKFNDNAIGFSLDSGISMAFHPNGTQLAFAYHNWNMGGFGEHWIGLWDWRSKTLLQTKQILFCGGNIESLDFSPDGSELILSAREDDIFGLDHAVYILDSQTLKEKRRIVLDQYQGFSACLDPSGQYLATILHNWDPPENSRYFPKGDYLALWDLASTKKIFEQEITETEHISLTWSPHGNYLITGVNRANPYSEYVSQGKPSMIIWKVSGLYPSQVSN